MERGKERKKEKKNRFCTALSLCDTRLESWTVDPTLGLAKAGVGAVVVVIAHVPRKLTLALFARFACSGRGGTRRASRSCRPPFDSALAGSCAVAVVRAPVTCPSRADLVVIAGVSGRLTDRDFAADDCAVLVAWWWGDQIGRAYV